MQNTRHTTRHTAASLLAPAFAVLAGALLAACGDDLVAVKGRLSDPAPQASAFRDTIADDALTTLYVLEQLPDGAFDYDFSDGSRLSGTLDRSTGAFDILQELPPGYYLVSVRDSGVVEFDGEGGAIAADYRETQAFVTGESIDYDVEARFQGNDLSISARELGRGTRIESLADRSVAGIVIRERWSLANVYVEDIELVYHAGGLRDVEQHWIRDDLATDVQPDHSGDFTFFRDGTGSGAFVRFFDHDIYAAYTVQLDEGGRQTTELIFEDPATAVTPDGVGLYQYDPDYSGTGLYTERYDDGSELRSDLAFQVDGSTDELFRFDEASTGFSPDTDGETHYRPDGSGTGLWRRHDATGVIETCNYSFDTAGNVLQVDCT